MKKKKEEKEARKLQEKMKSKDKKGKEPKSEGGPELSLSTEDSSLTEVSEDVAGEDQEWAEILNFNPNFDGTASLLSELCSKQTARGSDEVSLVRGSNGTGLG
jgi:hypothetical protein